MDGAPAGVGGERGAADKLPAICPRHCWSCGYELGGRVARCPECSRPFGLNTDDRKLANSPAGHVRRLRLGLDLVIFGAVAFPLGPVLWIAWGAASGPIGWAVCGAGVCVASAGWLLLSTPDPMLHDTPREARARRVSRPAPFVFLLLGVIVVGLSVFLAVRGPIALRPGRGLVLVAITLVACVATAGWEIGTAWTYLGFIAARLDQPRDADVLSVHGRTARAIALAGSSVVVFAAAVVLLARQFRRPSPVFELVFAAALALLALLAFPRASVLFRMPQVVAAVWRVRRGLRRLETAAGAAAAAP